MPSTERVEASIEKLRRRSLPSIASRTAAGLAPRLKSEEGFIYHCVLWRINDLASKDQEKEDCNCQRMPLTESVEASIEKLRRCSLPVSLARTAVGLAPRLKSEEGVHLSLCVVEDK
ncbi:hypothetical protein CEXT_768731 [Caerostris extrusa]|uniref:Uncharacterized protein n=1 Tax=Caerostris extrusa TaxID=172846 RepID=A0AAV4PXD8_CAEEX|nr:hypothetical protein CEXT_768731 [Caerostris extrusa]